MGNLPPRPLRSEVGLTPTTCRLGLGSKLGLGLYRGVLILLCSAHHAKSC